MYSTVILSYFKNISNIFKFIFELIQDIETGNLAFQEIALSLSAHSFLREKSNFRGYPNFEL